MAQTDRFYNAPEGPSTQPVDELPRRAHYDIQSSPNMFGGLIAEGLKNLGGEISSATNAFGEVAADQATNNFMGTLSDQRSQFEATKGQDTMQAHDEYLTNIQKTFDDNRATVPPQFAKNYDNFARRYLFNAKEGAASHLAQQSNSWAQGVAQSKDQTAIAAISANPNDEGAFQLNSEQMAKAAVNQLQLKEGITDPASASPDAQLMLRNTYDQARARAAYARIEAIRPTDPGKALEWQKQYAPLLGKLGPEVQQQLKGYQQQQNINQVVADGDAHAAGGGTAVAAAPTAPKTRTYTDAEGNKQTVPVLPIEASGKAPWIGPTDASGGGVQPASSVGGNPEPAAPTVPSSFHRLSPEGQSIALGGGVAGVRVPPQYAPMVQSAGSKWGVDPSLLARQLQQENGFKAEGRSPAGAEGIAQFIPGTAARYGVNVHDPQSSIEGQAHYMSDLQKMFGGNQGLALAGYNWGEGNVQRWLRAGADPAHLPAETAKYVRSISGHDLSEWVKNPGIPIHTVPLGPGQQGEGADIYHAGGTPTGPMFYRPQAPGPGGAPSGGSAPSFQGPSGSQDPGGGGQAVSLAPSIQPASFSGPGGGQLPQGQAPQTDDAQSSYDVSRDRISQAMMYTMGRTDIDEHTKDQALQEYEKRFRFATFASEQDAATKAKFSNEAVDRSLRLAIGGNGTPGDAQAGYRTLTDAFQRHVIDGAAYERGTAALQKFSGETDDRILGSGYADLSTGKVPLSYDNIQALSASGSLTRKGFTEAMKDLKGEEGQEGASDGYQTEKKYAFQQAESYLKWETTDGLGKPIKNPKGEGLMNDYANMFVRDVEAARKADPTLKNFPYFDRKKNQEKLEGMYSQRERQKDSGGVAFLTKPQADADDAAWAASPTHTPAPDGFRQDAWQSTVAQPPQSADGGFAIPHYYWDRYLRTLAANPTPTARAQFDEAFGPKGTVAAGQSADEVLRRLRGDINRPGTPTPAPAASAPTEVGTPLGGGAEAIRRGIAASPHSVAPLPGVMHDLGRVLGVGGSGQSPFPAGTDFGPASVESRE